MIDAEVWIVMSKRHFIERLAIVTALIGLMILSTYIVVWQDRTLEKREFDRERARINARFESLEKELNDYKDTIKRLKIKKMVTTGYSNDRHSINISRWRDGRTATMKRVRKGICASDWDVLPPGTVVYIEGYGRCEIQDRGGAIKGNKLDLFFPTRREALRWGIKELEVVIIPTG